MEGLDSKSLSIIKKTKVITMWQGGQTKASIREETGCSVKSITKWVKDFCEFGMAGLLADKRKTNKGPRKTTEAEDQALYDAALANNFGNAKKYAAKCSLNISAKTVQRRLHEKGFMSCKTLKKVYLTDDNRRKRVEHCKKYTGWSDKEWDKVIWSDETSFKTTTDSSATVWQKKNSRTAPENVIPIARSNQVSSRYWGCMTSKGLMSLVELDLPFNSEKYIDLLENTMYPAARTVFPVEDYETIIFMQDNSPVHTARIVNEWFEEHPDIELYPHPPSSPDLNPLENIWGLVKKNCNPTDKLNNKDDLCDYATIVWNQLAERPDYCQNIVHSMKKRMLDIINNNGYWIKY